MGRYCFCGNPVPHTKFPPFLLFLGLVVLHEAGSKLSCVKKDADHPKFPRVLRGNIIHRIFCLND
jgi:hypothetical protein